MSKIYIKTREQVAMVEGEVAASLFECERGY